MDCDVHLGTPLQIAYGWQSKLLLSAEYGREQRQFNIRLSKRNLSWLLLRFFKNSMFLQFVSFAKYILILVVPSFVDVNIFLLFLQVSLQFFIPRKKLPRGTQNSSRERYWKIMFVCLWFELLQIYSMFNILHGSIFVWLGK